MTDMWKDIYKVKKIIHAIANAENEFTINLQDYWTGQNKLDKNKIEVFTMLKNIDLPYFSLGYEIKCEDSNPQGLLPIYKVHFNNEVLNEDAIEIFDDSTLSNRENIIEIPEDSVSVMFTGGYSTEGKSSYSVYLNDNLKYSSNKYSDVYFSGVIPLEKGTKNVIKTKIIQSGKLYGRSESCYIQTKLIGSTPNVEISCFFIIYD